MRDVFVIGRCLAGFVEFNLMLSILDTVQSGGYNFAINTRADISYSILTWAYCAIFLLS